MGYPRSHSSSITTATAWDYLASEQPKVAIAAQRGGLQVLLRDFSHAGIISASCMQRLVCITHAEATCRSLRNYWDVLVPASTSLDLCFNCVAVTTELPCRYGAPVIVSQLSCHTLCSNICLFGHHVHFLMCSTICMSSWLPAHLDGTHVYTTCPLGHFFFVFLTPRRAKAKTLYRCFHT